MIPLNWLAAPCFDCGAKPTVNVVPGPDGFLGAGARALCAACDGRHVAGVDARRDVKQMSPWGPR